MVQIQRMASTSRSGDEFADLDITQAVEFLANNLDLSDDMALMGMENLFDDVDEVIKDDKDIFMGCAEDSQLKNDILMRYNDESISMPESITSQLDTSSDDSQDQPSYSELTPDSDIMDSDIVSPEMADSEAMDDPEEMDSDCPDESAIPLVALALTGAIPPLKNTRRGRRKGKSRGVTKRKPVKRKPARVVAPKRQARLKQTVPDVECVKVCPPPASMFSPSTMFPTIMSALRLNTNTPVPLERLVKPKSPAAKLVDQISGIQTPPSTPVELKPAVSLTDTTPALQDMGSAAPPPQVQAEESESETAAATQSLCEELNNILTTPVTAQDQPSPVVSSETCPVTIKTEPIEVLEQDEISEAEISIEDSESKQELEVSSCKCGEEGQISGPVKTYKKATVAPAQTYMQTRGLSKRRPSYTTTRKQRSKVTTASPQKQTNEQPQTSEVTVSMVASAVTNCEATANQAVKSETVPQTIVPPSPVVAVATGVTQAKAVTSTTVSVASSAVTLSPMVTKPNGATMVAVQQPKTLQQLPAAQIITHPGRIPHSLAQISAVPLTTIPARSTILGVLPTMARLRPATVTSVQTLPSAVAHPVTNTSNIPVTKPEPPATSTDASSVASRNSEILSLLTKQTNLSCVKMEEETLPRSYSGYSSSSSSSGSPPPQSPVYSAHYNNYTAPPTPAVVSIKEELPSDFSDEEDYEMYKKVNIKIWMRETVSISTLI